MRTFRFGKLVRDKILPDMEKEGSVVVSRLLSDEEYVEELLKKLAEEVHELTVAAEDEKLSELADVHEVLAHLSEVLGIDDAKIAAKRAAKNEKAGSFKNRVFVETVSVDDNNPWIKTYVASPDRYPEVK